MIAETAILSSSPWQTDFLLKDDGLFDSMFDRSRYLASDDFGRITPELGSVSSGNSVASSICSDESPVDTEFDDHLFTSNKEYLNNSLLGMFGEGNVAVEAIPSVGLWDEGILNSDVQLMDLMTDEESDITPRASSPPRPSHKRSISESSTEHMQATPWSKVCSREQISVVEDLTHIISTQMGLREQLEVIRMINPTANISPTDSEFVIDLNCLNDVKLQEITEYVRRNARCTSNDSPLCNNNNNNTDQNTDQNSCCSSVESSSECNFPAQKRVITKKQRREERREARQRQRKEYRQMMKERRSGLFQKEEVLSLTNNCDPESSDNDQDVDIL